MRRWRGLRSGRLARLATAGTLAVCSALAPQSAVAGEQSAGATDLAALSREVRFEGGLVAPALVWRLSGAHVALPGLADADVQIEVRLPVGRAQATFELHARAGAAEVAATGTFETVRDGDAYVLAPTRPAALHLTAKGYDLAGLGAFLPSMPLLGRADLVLDVQGSPARPATHLTLAAPAGALRWRGEPLDRTALELDADERRTRLDVSFAPADAAVPPYLTLSADVPIGLRADAGLRPALSWRDDLPHRVTLTGRGLDARRLRPFWRAPGGAAFAVDLDATLDGHLDRFLADAAVRGTLTPKGQAPLSISAWIKAEPRRQAAFARLGRDVFEASVSTEVPLPDVIRGRAAPAAAALHGEGVAALPLDLLSPFLVESGGALTDLSGRLTGSVTLGGTLGAPAVEGELHLADAALTVRALLLRLTEVSGEIALSGTRAVLRTLSAKAAPGALLAQGALELHPVPAPTGPAVLADWTLDGSLTLDATDLPLVQPEIPRGFLTGHLDAAWRSGPGKDVIDLRVDAARVALSDASLPPARGIPRNGGVVHRDWLARETEERSILAGEGRLELTLDVPQPVRIRGRDTSLDVQGRLALRRQDAHVEVDGGLDVLAGQFVLFENPFTLRRGRLTLQSGELGVSDTHEADASVEVRAELHDPERPPEAAPLEPVLDLLANGYVVDTDVTVAVRGPARQPQLIMRSNPALAEYQILTLLVTGRANALDDSDGDVRREASQLVDRFHNPSLERQVYDRLGVDKLGLAFGDAVDQPILTVGRQIDRDLYVETVYHHNAPPTANARELRVEYQLTPRLSIDTAYGDAAVGNLELAFKGRFGGEAPARPLSSLEGDAPSNPPPAPGSTSGGPP